MIFLGGGVRSEELASLRSGVGLGGVWRRLVTQHVFLQFMSTFLFALSVSPMVRRGG